MTLNLSPSPNPIPNPNQVRELSSHAAELFALKAIGGMLTAGDPYRVPQPGFCQVRVRVMVRVRVSVRVSVRVRVSLLTYAPIFSPAPPAAGQS